MPFHRPRYIGHMVSDLLSSGLTTQTLTLPCNPNKVITDAVLIERNEEADRTEILQHTLMNPFFARPLQRQQLSRGLLRVSESAGRADVDRAINASHSPVGRGPVRRSGPGRY